MRRHRFFVAVMILLATIVAALPAVSGDAVGAIGVVWRDFVSAVRRGDYGTAHGMFSEQSRSAFPLREFAREYGPLSASREAILEDPSSLAVEADGDWGSVRFAVTLPLSRRAVRVAVAFVRNDDVWSVVAARNEERERIEAAGRAILRKLLPRVGRRDAAEYIRASVDRELGGSPLLRVYDFSLAGGTLRAVPKAVGFRSFYIDAWGIVRQGRGDAPERLRDMPPSVENAPNGRSGTSGTVVPTVSARGAPSPESAAIPPDLVEPPPLAESSDLGELPDPGDGSVGPGGSDSLPPLELPDPALPPRPAPGIEEPSYLTLPDRIS